MKKTIESKIKSYSTLTVGLLAASGVVNAQIKYTDISPDKEVSNTEGTLPFSKTYSLDVNDDAQTDFQLEISGPSSTTYLKKRDITEITPLVNNEVLCDNGTDLPKMLNAGDSIDLVNQEWKDNSSDHNLNYFKVTYAYGFGFDKKSSGNWNQVFDKYLGLKVVISGETYYGWARLDVGENSYVMFYGPSVTPSFTVKDVAIQTFPGVPIKAGDTTTVVSSEATALSLSDFSDNGNGSDLQVSFTKAANEAKVKEYHLIAVQSAWADFFNTETAVTAILAGNSTTVAKTGSNITTAFTVDAKDNTGALIANDVAYKVFVVSVPDGYNATTSALSAVSSEITLTAVVPVLTDPITNLAVSDVADNNNGSDMQVAFDKAADETKVDSYRIVVVKSADAATFTVNDANLVSAGNYTSVSKTGYNISTALASTANDKDGAAIANDIAYKVFVLSVADGTNANTNVLSAASEELSLYSPVYAGEITNLTVTDIANNSNGSDLQVAFDKATDETTINEYRVIVVKTADAASFGLSAAELIAAGNYTLISKTGSNISTALASDAKDKDGDAITVQTAYQVFVLSIADGTNANINKLSSASGEHTLISVFYSDAAMNVQAGDIANNGNGSDLQVSFDKATDEAKVNEYRIIVVKTADAATFDLSAAETVASGNYTTISKTGSNIQTILPSDAKDKDGLTIAENTAFKVFVLSVADGTNANTNVLSTASTEITLTPAIYAGTITNLQLSDIADNQNGSDLQVSFDKASDEATISEYRVIVVKSADAVACDLSVAESVSSGNYTVVTKTGSNLTTILATDAKDKDGALIANDVAYKIFILSIADGTNANTNALSTASSELTLTTIVYAGTVANLSISDIADNQNGSDLQVSFDKASDETTVDEYRVIVVKTADAATFDLSAAESVVSGNYTSVSKTGSNLQVALSSTAKDIDGVAIANNVAYKVFVLSVADGTNANTNTLSTASSELTLTSILYADAVSNVALSDIGDNSNGSDLLVSFDKASDEIKIEEYRIIVMKTADATAFDLSAAESVTSGNYTMVSKTGSNINATLATDAKDKDGNAITDEVAYKVFVISVADGINANTNVLSAVSSEITLTNLISADGISNMIISDISNNGNASDIQITYNKATDESTISQYRAFVVKSANASSFDLLTASSLSSSYYTLIVKSNSNVQATLSSTVTDTDGDAIENNAAYRVFVLCVADGTNAQKNTLSSSSNELTLIDNTSINEIDDNGISIYQNNNYLYIDFENNSSLVGSELNIYDITGRVVETRHASSMNNIIPLETLTKGIYVVRITSNNKTYSKKIAL